MLHSSDRSSDTRPDLEAIIKAALSGTLSEEQATQLYSFGPEIVKFVLIAISKGCAELHEQVHQAKAKEDALHNTTGPSTPSGQKPIYTKQTTSGRRKKRGAKQGHQAHHRKKSDVNKRKTHRLNKCPICGGPLKKGQRIRTRIIEDIQKDIQPEVTEHTIHGDYCSTCKKYMEPIVEDAMPNTPLGHRLVCFSAWLHYGLGITISHIISILSFCLHFPISAGGLIAQWKRLAEVLYTWYEQIGQEALQSAILFADETGWRVLGKTYWLWCFANGTTCYYMIDRSRGSPALEKFFTTVFEGTLVTDFWAAYNTVCVVFRQMCQAHLLREIEKVTCKNQSDAWKRFAKKLGRLIRDAIRLRKREDFSPAKYRRRIERIYHRLDVLAESGYEDADVKRLAKRLCKYREHLFRFLEDPTIPFDNNFAERMIRPAVILRKNSQCNHSERGAAIQAILMSVYRTLKLRGHDPITTIVKALRVYVKTGVLPSLPS
jgi:transposase